MSERQFDIPADDGYRLRATLYGAEGAGPVTIIGSATGVPQRFYSRFATFLADHGRPTWTFDYRGIGGSAPASLVGFKARFRDWAIVDMPGVIDWARATYPNRPVHWIGHSYGGFALGLARNNAAIDRLFMFASMSADVRFMAPAARLALWPKFYVGTWIARARGFLPAGLVGSEALPKEVMLEWYRFCTTKGFIFSLDDLPELRHFETLRAPVRLSYALDDGWISRAGLDHLANRINRSADRTVWPIGPDEAGMRPLGHLGFFRAQHAGLWPKALDWLDGDRQHGSENSTHA